MEMCAICISHTGRRTAIPSFGKPLKCSTKQGWSLETGTTGPRIMVVLLHICGQKTDTSMKHERKNLILRFVQVSSRGRTRNFSGHVHLSL